MSVIHIERKQNKNTGVWYRVFLHTKLQLYCVQTYGMLPNFMYKDCYQWFLLMCFNNKKEAMSMFNCLLSIKDVEYMRVKENPIAFGI